jgi:hypothetical protein
MVSWLALIIVGIVFVVIAYYATLPPPGKMICNIVGWCCLLIGLVLFLVSIVPGLAR